MEVIRFPRAIVIKGFTDPYRRDIRRLGFKWNMKHRDWYFFSPNKDVMRRKYADASMLVNKCTMSIMRSHEHAKQRREQERNAMNKTVSRQQYAMNALLCMRSINANIPSDISRQILETAMKWEIGGAMFCTCKPEYLCPVCRYACCEKAIGVMCMCLQATTCPDHGFRCNGSHD